jgi:hypothetical protein
MIRLNNKEYTINQFINFVATETTTEVFCSNFDNLFFMKYYNYRRQNKSKLKYTSSDKKNTFQEFCDIIKESLKKNIETNDKLEFVESLLWNEVLKAESIEIQKIELFKLVISEFNILNYETLNSFDNNKPFNETIFNCEFGARLFDYLIKEIDTQSKQSEANFIFRVMKEKDNYIKSITHDDIDDYLCHNYNFIIGKNKTLQAVESDKRHKNYNETKKYLKSNLSQIAITKNTF